MKFIIQVAFECHDSEVIDPVRNLLKTKAHLALNDRSPIAAHVFTLESIGKEVVSFVNRIIDIHVSNFRLPVCSCEMLSC